jgi:hypothetical protein
MKSRRRVKHSIKKHTYSRRNKRQIGGSSTPFASEKEEMKALMSINEAARRTSGPLTYDMMNAVLDTILRLRVLPRNKKMRNVLTEKTIQIRKVEPLLQIKGGTALEHLAAFNSGSGLPAPLQPGAAVTH